jgi:hypothetical protein
VNGSVVGTGASADPYGDPTLSSVVCQDMKWNVTPGNHWLTAEIVISLTQGYIYSARGATSGSVLNEAFMTYEDDTWLAGSGPDFTYWSTANGKRYLNAPMEFTTWLSAGNVPSPADAAQGTFYPYGHPAVIVGGALLLTGNSALVLPTGYYQRMNSTTVVNTLANNTSMSAAWCAPAPDQIETGNIPLGRFSFSQDAIGTFKLLVIEYDQTLGSAVTAFDGRTQGNDGIIANGVMTVPEPASLSLLAVGGLALLRRRRR